MPDMFDLRVLLCSRSPSAALRTLDQPGYCVCAVAMHKAQLYALLPEVQPHILFFDEVLSDFSAVLQTVAQLLPLAPPRIVCRAGCTQAVDAEYSNDISYALHSAWMRPVGILSSPSFIKRQALADALLTRLGMPAQLLGKSCIARAVCCLSALPQPLPPLKHWLYPLLAQEENISAAAMERRIRSAIESTWLHGNLQAQSELFGFTVSAERGKPTNAEFLLLLAEHLRRKLL